MKPAAFAYHRPDTVEEALALLAEHGDEAELLAGGQSLVPMMNMRLARPSQIVDVNRLTGLNGVQVAGDVLEIGPLIRHHDLARSPDVRRVCPLLAHAASTIGHYAIRQRGTLGGSLAVADPSAQLPLIAVLLDAEIVLRSVRGERCVAAREFFIAAMTTEREDDEMIAAVRIPLTGDNDAWGFEMFAPRAGDYAIVLAAALVRREGEGRIAAARVALGGIGGAPEVFSDVLGEHFGETPDNTWPVAVAEHVAAKIEPEEIGRFDATYKRDLARALVERAFVSALGSAEGLLT